MQKPQIYAPQKALVAENVQVIYKFERLHLRKVYHLITIVVMTRYQDQ